MVYNNQKLHSDMMRLHSAIDTISTQIEKNKDSKASKVSDKNREKLITDIIANLEKNPINLEFDTIRFALSKQWSDYTKELYSEITQNLTINERLIEHVKGVKKTVQLLSQKVKVSSKEEIEPENDSIISKEESILFKLLQNPEVQKNLEEELSDDIQKQSQNFQKSLEEFKKTLTQVVHDVYGVEFKKSFIEGSGIFLEQASLFKLFAYDLIQRNISLHSLELFQKVSPELLSEIQNAVKDLTTKQIADYLLDTSGKITLHMHEKLLSDLTSAIRLSSEQSKVFTETVRLRSSISNDVLILCVTQPDIESAQAIKQHIVDEQDRQTLRALQDVVDASNKGSILEKLQVIKQRKDSNELLSKLAIAFCKIHWPEKCFMTLNEMTSTPDRNIKGFTITKIAKNLTSAEPKKAYEYTRFIEDHEGKGDYVVQVAANLIVLGVEKYEKEICNTLDLLDALDKSVNEICDEAQSEIIRNVITKLVLTNTEKAISFLNQCIKHYRSSKSLVSTLESLIGKACAEKSLEEVLILLNLIRESYPEFIKTYSTKIKKIVLGYLIEKDLDEAVFYILNNNTSIHEESTLFTFLINMVSNKSIDKSLDLLNIIKLNASKSVLDKKFIDNCLTKIALKTIKTDCTKALEILETVQLIDSFFIPKIVEEVRTEDIQELFSWIFKNNKILSKDTWFYCLLQYCVYNNVNIDLIYKIIPGIASPAIKSSILSNRDILKALVEFDIKKILNFAQNLEDAFVKKIIFDFAIPIYARQNYDEALSFVAKEKNPPMKIFCYNHLITHAIESQLDETEILSLVQKSGSYQLYQKALDALDKKQETKFLAETQRNLLSTIENGSLSHEIDLGDINSNESDRSGDETD